MNTITSWPTTQQRVYVKEDPEFRNSKMFLTKLGLFSMILAGLAGMFFAAFTLRLIN